MTTKIGRINAQMFWKKKSHDDILFLAATERSRLFVSLASLQSVKVALFMRLSTTTNLHSGFHEAIIYVYYDTFAALHSQDLAKEKNDIIKAYLRDWALSSFDDLVSGQFRTYAANTKNYQQLSSKPIHPTHLLEILRAKPTFDAILQHKVNEKIAELIDYIYSNDPAVGNQLEELFRDEELLKSYENNVDLSQIVLKCKNCFCQEKLEDINTLEDSKMCVFKTGERRTGDDLEILSFFCFECQNITKFSIDPYDFSGNAENGVEYFSSQDAKLCDVKNALLYLRSNADFLPALRLISSFPEVIDELKDL